MYAKIISKKWDEGRNINVVRNRTSQRIQDHRRSLRSAVLNQLRQVEITKEEKKRTAQEEKLQKLKAYKVEKQKRMEELKKTQRPPFHSLVKVRHTGSTPYREHPVSRLQDKKNDKKAKPLGTGPFGVSSSNTCKPINSKNNEIRKPVKPIDKKPNLDAPSSSRNVVKPMVLRNNEIKDPLKQNGFQKVVERKKGKENKLDTKMAPQVPTYNGKNTTKPVLSTRNPDTKNPVTRNTRPQRAVQTRKMTSKPPVGKSPVKVLTDVINTGVQTRNARKNTFTTRKLATRITRQQTGQHNSSDSKSASEEEVTKPKEEGIKEIKQEQDIEIETKEIDVELENKNDVSIKEEYIESVSPAIVAESNSRLAKGAAYHRQRLQSTIDRLTKEADSWERRKEDNLSDEVKDEILAVVGKTRLLIAKRLGKFKGLVDRCEFPLPEQLEITLEDLDGYWDVVYQQVDQLDQQYANLRDLESNNWQKKEAAATRKPAKKGGCPKKKSINKPAKSRFREFLKSKQNEMKEVPSETEIPVPPGGQSVRKSKRNEMKEVPSETEIPVTPSGQSVRNGDTTQSSLYMSASKGEEMEFGPSSKLENLRTPTRTPAMKKALFSRRSSAALITVKRSSFMKF